MNIAILNKVNFYKKFSNICVFVLLLVSSLYFTQQRSFPYIYHDEYGVLGAAAIFSGLDWETPPGMAFYGFLLSLLTFPLYWLDLGPTGLYRSVLAVNSFLVASSALLALKTIRLLMPDSQSELWRIGAVFAGFSYPAVMHYSALAIGETTLLFCFSLSTYYMAVLLKTNHIQIGYAITLGIGMGMAQYAHPRGVVFIIAGFCTIFYAYKIGMLLRTNFIITVIAIFITVMLLAYVKAYLQTNFYSHEHENASLLSFVSARVGWPSIATMNLVILKSIGQIIYLATSTFGLILLGLSILLFNVFNKYENVKALLRLSFNKSDANILKILSGFILSSFILMFIASVMQMVIVSRADSFFYGRYNEVIIPTLIIISIMYLSFQSRKNSLRCFIPYIIISVSLVFLIQEFYSEELKMTTNWSSITSWFIYIYGRWEINPKFIFIGMSITSTCLIISLLLSRGIFVTVLTGYFLLVTLLNFEVQHSSSDRNKYILDKISNKAKYELSGYDLKVNGSGTNAKIGGEIMQFTFPKMNVSFNNGNIREADVVLEHKVEYCNAQNTLAYLNRGRICILNKVLYEKIETAMLLPLVFSTIKIEPIRYSFYVQKQMQRFYK